jgi:hypothetical protein
MSNLNIDGAERIADHWQESRALSRTVSDPQNCFRELVVDLTDTANQIHTLLPPNRCGCR